MAWRCPAQQGRAAAGALVPCARSTLPLPGPSCAQYQGGLTVLEFYGLSGISAWGWMAIELAFFAVFFTGAYLALAFVKHTKR